MTTFTCASETAYVSNASLDEKVEYSPETTISTVSYCRVDGNTPIVALSTSVDQWRSKVKLSGSALHISQGKHVRSQAQGRS